MGTPRGRGDTPRLGRRARGWIRGLRGQSGLWGSRPGAALTCQRTRGRREHPTDSLGGRARRLRGESPPTGRPAPATDVKKASENHGSEHPGRQEDVD